MSTENYIQIMIDSLTQKELLLKQIEDYNEEQKVIITAAEFDADAFKGNVDKKSELVEKILKIDDGFNALFLRVKDEIQAHKAELSSEIASLQQLVKRVTDLGVCIEAQELRNKELVEKCFSAMRRHLSNARSTTSKANEYYRKLNNINDYDSHFLDQKK